MNVNPEKPKPIFTDLCAAFRVDFAIELSHPKISIGEQTKIEDCRDFQNGENFSKSIAT